MLDNIGGYEYVSIGKNRYVKRKYFFKKPMRIMFVILLSELEERLYRAAELRQGNTEGLNDKNLNDLIRMLLENDPISLQTEYESKAAFKDDLKALSSFRNIIFHINKKLEESIDYETIIKRKKQALRSLVALQQITDNLKERNKIIDSTKET